VKTPVFEVYEAEDGWRWRLIARNNRIIATGESHPKKAGADKALRTVIDTAKLFDLSGQGSASKYRP
jgi:uncharacterized protein YegP (UPF0339 family)